MNGATRRKEDEGELKRRGGCRTSSVDWTLPSLRVKPHDRGADYRARGWVRS
jgi:hypothetical protein